MRRLIQAVFFGALLLGCGAPFFVSAAADFTLTPVVIDGKGKQREILRYTVTIANTSNHLVSIYPWITDIDPALGATGNTDLSGSQGKDLSESLARWMEVTRGVIDLLPGEKRDVPVMVQVHLNAKPGVYHAAIHFSEGSNRANAEANTSATLEVAVNIEVLEDINERLQLALFKPEKTFFSGNSAAFDYRIENIGNRGLIPHGKIRIYNRRGEEIVALDANQGGTRLEPNAKEMLGSVWSAGDHFGRYKAMLDLEYGGRGTLQDTVFFWIIPWKKILSMFFALALLCVIAAIGLHSYGTSRRSGMYAPALVSGGFRGVAERFSLRRGEKDAEDDEMMSRVGDREELDRRQSVHTESILEETRLASRAATRTSSTALKKRTTPVEPRHQVYLEKRERPVPPPEHVVNLKK